MTTVKNSRFDKRHHNRQINRTVRRSPRLSGRSSRSEQAELQAQERTVPKYVIAPNAELVREYARQGGFLAKRISTVRAIIGPTTAET
jgi:hypothetical protein